MRGRPAGPARTAPDGPPAEDAYRLVAIEPTKAPDGSSGRDWFAYRIAQGANMIRGCRRGSLADVTAGVAQIVINLNDRRMVRRGRVDLIPAKPAAAPETARELLPPESPNS